MKQPAAETPVLSTPRLLLRRLGEADAAFIHTLVNESAFLQHIGDRGVRTLDDARRYIREGPMASYAQYGFGLYAVVAKDSGEACGICGLLQRDSLDAPDVGFAFLDPHRRRGYALEAAGAVLEHARRHLGLERILAVVSPGNTASSALLGKIGFRFEGMIRLSGGDSDLELFASDPV